MSLSRFRGSSIVLAPIYGVYTRRLREDVLRRALPRHVAVILDGNRRWATLSGLGEPGAGHLAGARKLDELIDLLTDLRRDLPHGERLNEVFESAARWRDHVVK